MAWNYKSTKGREMRKNNYVEVKQQAIKKKKKTMGQQWNQRGNLKIWEKWQWKYNHTKSMKYSKSSS